MRKNLLEFLFGDTVIRESSQNIGEQVLKLFEDAADEETEEMVSSKEPLVTALKSLDIDAGVEAVAQGCELTCTDANEYRRYVRILSDPENLHTLASKGWVPAKCGDVAMTFEPAELKIGFIEIATAETSDTDKAPDLEKVLKDAQKFAATEIDRDDDMNPVERDHKPSKDHRKGISEPKEGAQPEGKPKGSTKTTESRQRIHSLRSKEAAHSRPPTPKQVAESLLEMTSTGGVPAVDCPALRAPKIDWRKRNAAQRKRRGETTDERP